jgi:hypothetical protein
MLPRVVVTVSLIVLTSVLSDAMATPTSCIDKVFEYGMRFDLTNLNKAAVVETWESKNLHEPGDVIIWKNIHWNHGWVTTRECAPCSPKAGITELFLTTDQPGLPCGLNKGMLIDDILELMGEPDRRNGNELVYLYPPIDKNEEIAFQFKEGKLWGIKWSFYND